MALASSPAWGPCGAAGQETVLERWTVGYLADTWSHRWAPPRVGWGPSAVGGRSSFAAWTEAEIVSLRSEAELVANRLGVSSRVPLGPSVDALVIATSARWETDQGSTTVIETPRSQSLGLGLAYRMAALGQTVVEVVAGWDEGPGGMLKASARSSRLGGSLAVWTVAARPSRVRLPADSLGTFGIGQTAVGVEAELSATLSIEQLELSPAVTWKAEFLERDVLDAAAFLTTSPEGEHRSLRVGLDAGYGAWGASVWHRVRKVELDSPILRLDTSAGRLNQVLLDLSGWTLSISRGAGARRWTVTGESDDLSGRLSARVETWPFVSLWATLTAQAYRLNGDVSARGRGLTLSTSPEDRRGWHWGARITQMALRVDRDSWYVTAFGFGRIDRETTASGVDSAVLVGGEASTTFGALAGDVSLHMEAGLPVHARPLPGATLSGTGFAGYVGIRIAWTR